MKMHICQDSMITKVIEGQKVIFMLKTFFTVLYLDYFLINLMGWLGPNSTKMCIKSAPYLHQKSSNRALNMVLFWYFGVYVAHQICPKKGAVSAKKNIVMLD